MNGIDPQFLLARNLQEIFRDKLSGEPLANGYVEFYHDNNRTLPKDVYTKTSSGTPPAYSYIDIGSTLTLSGIGTFTYMGADINVYYLPQVDVDDTTTDLYFIKVFSEDNVLQFTREGWPNSGTNASPNPNGTEFVNYVANGQFLAHNDVGGTTNNELPTGQASSYIAQGGWSIERPNGTSSVDAVTFTRLAMAQTDLGGFPRFSIDIACTSPDSLDAYKALRLTFPDVKKFASSTQSYTYYFSAIANTSTLAGVALYLVRNYGTSGSAQTETLLTTFGTITNTESVFSFNFIFGDNFVGKTISPDDDFVALELRFPVNTSFDVSLTDFVLAQGNIATFQFPVTPNFDFLTDSLPGYIPPPNPDGSDLYLPIICTQKGFDYDGSCIGDIRYTIRDTLPSNVLPCDGTQYKTSDYSSLGIPYARLQAFLFDATYGVPRFGTGSQFFTAAGDTSGDFRIVNNATGVVTATANGSIPTTYAFQNASLGTTTNFVQAYHLGAPFFTLIGENIGLVTNAAAGTTTFTFQFIRNSAGTEFITKVTSIVASAITAGNYWTFTSINGAATPVNYYVWYQKDGVGADPAPGGTGIKCNVAAIDTADIVAQKTMEAVNGWNSTFFPGIAGSAIPNNSSVLIHAVGADYNIWFNVDGAGVNPNQPGTDIEVAIGSADSAATVSTKVIAAVNTTYFATPDLRGAYLRILQTTDDGLDTYSAYRLTKIPGLPGGRMIGTYLYDTLLQHLHSITHGHEEGAPAGTSLPVVDVTAPVVTFNLPVYTDNTGDAENNVRNIYVNAYIIY